MPKRKRFNDFVRTQSVKFTMFSPKEIRALAVTDVTHDKIYNKHLPNQGGMNDPRMGTMDRRISCTTCINDNKDCPGHAGKIELPVPMYSVGFIQNTYSLLKTICPFCFRINIDENDFKAATILETCEDERVRDDQLFIGLTKIAKDKNKCFRCEMPLPKYSIKGAIIDWEWDSEAAILLANLGVWSSYGRPFNAADALSILENVPDDDYRLIGLSPKESHPSWAILTVTLIPPPPVRPAIMVSEGSKTKGQDDLTSIYQVVIKTCMELDGIIEKMKQDKVKCVPKFDVPKLAKKKKNTVEVQLAKIDETVTTMRDQFGLSEPDYYSDNKSKKKKTSSSIRAAPSIKDMEEQWTNSLSKTELFNKKEGYCETDGDFVALLWEKHPKVMEKLQRHLAAIVNNDGKIVPQVNQRSGNPMKTIRARLDTKHGRVRGHLMGKRVDFSGRTVVSPGPDLDIDELGIPEEIARILTIPERVTSFNKERLTEAVQNGANVWPGAKRILCSDGRVIYLEFIEDREGIELEDGWIVERHLRYGDPVLFNRQPSLHRMSLMCFKAKIMTKKRPSMNYDQEEIEEEPMESAFRLNLACTKIFNADFDGDEMNIHVLQSIQANAEALYLMAIEKHIISPQNNAPIISLVQNSLLAAYLLTQDGVEFTRDQMELALRSIRYPLKAIPEPDCGNAKDGYRWSGRRLFSLVLPNELNMTIHMKDNKVVIEDGIMLEGRLCKKSLGTSPGNIIDIIVRDIGKREAVIFLSDSQRILDWYLQRRGFSIGIDDYYVSKETEEKVKSILDDTKYVSDVIGKIQEIEHLVHDDDLASLEAKIIKMLGSILDRASLYILDEYSKRDPANANAMLTMILSGAKGNTVNITSLSVAVGQQIVEGGRLRKDRFGRTLPMWKAESCDPEVQGFVRENYLNGLSPEGAFAHYMGGREGLVDTAVKTSRSGYLQRQIVKALDGITVSQDLSVRMEGKQIVQFLYGGDGMDPMEIEKVGDVSPLFVNNGTIAKWSQNHKKWIRMLLACRDTARKQLTSLMARELPEFVLLPVHVKRFLQNFLRKRHEVGEPCDKDVAFTIMRTVSQSLKMILGHEATSVQRYFLLAYINPSTIEEYSLSEGDLNQLCEQVLEKVQVSTITPGAMVGILAGQSAGEQATQTTLNSVARWEHVMVRHNGIIKNIEIGSFIDSEMSQHVITHIDGSEELKVDNIEVLSTSSDGMVGWRKVESLSRHPVKGNKLLKVTTRSGKTVNATKAKSFVIIDQEKLIPVDGETIKVGDRVPIAAYNSCTTPITFVDLDEYFPKNEYLYTSVVNDVYTWRRTNRNWWAKFKDQLPYSRGDSLTSKVSERPELLVGDKICHKFSKKYMIERRMELTEEFGFLCGAYIAEGAHSDHFVVISNNDVKFRNRVVECVGQLGFHTREVTGRKFDNEKWKSESIVVHGTLFADLMKKLCGKGSAGKKLPSFVWNAPQRFIKGLLTSYIWGDGSVKGEKEQSCTFGTVSIELGEQLCSLLSLRCGISSSKRYSKLHNGSGWISLSIRGHSVSILSGYLSMEGYKNDSLVMACEKITSRDNSKKYFTRIIGEEKINDVVEDIIVSIEEVEYPDLAYDFTVEALDGNDDTRTFTLANGLVVFDTFHFAGKGNINVASGVPRFMEIINMSPNPSTPSMTLALNIPEEVKDDPEPWIQKCIRKLVSISLLSIVEDHYPVIDPVTDEEPYTRLPEHHELMTWSAKVYGTEQDLVSEIMAPSSRVWCFVLRKKIMEQQSLTPFMVATAINQVSSKYVTTIHFSEANMDQWHIRIRMWNVKDSVDEDKLQTHIMKTTNLGGVKGITYAIPMKRPIHHFNEDGSVEEMDEWVIRTQGSSIHGVSGLDFVDWKRSYSNHIPETFTTLGIGACRTLIIREIQKVVSFEGSYVDLRHIIVLANALTFRGYPMATSRHGQNRVNTGPLMRASFEETGEMILHAGYHAEKDNLLGLTPSLMLGQLAPIGTGMFGIQRDEIGFDKDREHLSSQEHLYSLNTMAPSRKECVDPETGLVYGSHELAKKTTVPFEKESKAKGEIDIDPGYVWEKTKKDQGVKGRKVRFVEGTKAPARGAYADIDEKQNLDHLDDVLVVKERNEKSMNPLASERNKRVQMYKKYIQEVDTMDIDMSGVEMHQETDDTMRNTMGTKLNVYMEPRKRTKDADSQDISIGAKEKFGSIPGLGGHTEEEEPFVVASPHLLIK